MVMKRHESRLCLLERDGNLGVYHWLRAFDFVEIGLDNNFWKVPRTRHTACWLGGDE